MTPIIMAVFPDALKWCDAVRARQDICDALEMALAIPARSEEYERIAAEDAFENWIRLIYPLEGKDNPKWQ